MEYHGLKPIPDISGRSEKLFQKHLLEAHRMKYVEKRKGEKNFKADSDSLLTPGLTKTMVVFVLKVWPKQAYKSSLNVPKGQVWDVGLALAVYMVQKPLVQFPWRKMKPVQEWNMNKALWKYYLLDVFNPLISLEVRNTPTGPETV